MVLPANPLQTGLLAPLRLCRRWQSPDKCPPGGDTREVDPCYGLSGCSGCLGWVGVRNKKRPLGPTVANMLRNHWGSGLKVSRKELRRHQVLEAQEGRQDEGGQVV